MQFLLKATRVVVNLYPVSTEEGIKFKDINTGTLYEWSELDNVHTRVTSQIQEVKALGVIVNPTISGTMMSKPAKKTPSRSKKSKTE